LCYHGSSAVDYSWFRYTIHRAFGVLVTTELIFYPTPINFYSIYSCGSLVGFLLVNQLITGLLLTSFYIPSIDLAFNSVDYVMREVNYGWAVRYLHSNGASFYFTLVYIHIGRGIYYTSYQKPRDKVWFSGVFLFLVIMITAFIGYVLPFGQLSY